MKQPTPLIVQKFDSIVEFFDSIPQSYQQYALAIHDILIKEYHFSNKLSYNCSFYYDSNEKAIIYLNVHKGSYLVVAFVNGAHMNDPYKALSAPENQKQIRHFMVPPEPDDDFWMALTALIDEAVITNLMLAKK